MKLCNKLKRCCVSLLLLLPYTIASASAADINFGSDAFTLALSTAVNFSLKLVLPLSAVSVAFLGINLFFCGEKGMDICKKWGKRIVLTLIVLCILPSGIVLVYQFFVGMAWNPDVASNPIIIPPAS